MSQKQKDAPAQAEETQEEESQPKDLKNEELEKSTTDVLDEIDSALEDSVFVDDFDAVLDEIEDILEPNAEEFVRNYIQRSGQ